MSLDSFHVMWTQPKISRGIEIMKDYEVFIFALSALTYKQFTGKKVRLITDAEGKRFYENVLWAWDDVDIELLEHLNGELHRFPPANYENAGKIFALTNLELPYLYIDNDALFYQELPEDLLDLDCVYGHREFYSKPYDEFSELQMKQFAYPPKENYNTPKGYEFNSDFDWENSPVLNTCLLYLSNKGLQKEFKSEFDRFLFDNGGPLEKRFEKAQFLFLDQRLLGLLLKTHNYRHSSFLPVAWDISEFEFIEDQARGKYSSITHFHHIWHTKEVLKTKTLQSRYIKEVFDRMISFGVKTDSLRKLTDSLPQFQSLWETNRK